MFKSEPLEGAIVNDWTDKTLVLDLENSLGENFHFEIEPDSEEKVKGKKTDDPSKEKKNPVYVYMKIMGGV